MFALGKGSWRGYPNWANKLANIKELLVAAHTSTKALSLKKKKKKKKKKRELVLWPVFQSFFIWTLKSNLSSDGINQQGINKFVSSVHTPPAGKDSAKRAVRGDSVLLIRPNIPGYPVAAEDAAGPVPSQSKSQARMLNINRAFMK